MPKGAQQGHTVKDLELIRTHVDVGQVGPSSTLKVQLSFHVPCTLIFILLTTMDVYRR